MVYNLWGYYLNECTLKICLKRSARISIVLWAMLLLAPAVVDAKPEILLPQTGLSAGDVSVIINDEDTQSKEVGEYYQQARHIPAANIIHISFATGRHVLGKDEFLKLKTEIDRLTPSNVQAYAVTWTDPYRVDCMSITSALAFGFDTKYCSAKQCSTTKPSPYFNSASLNPAKKLKMRPAMMLAGTDFAQVKKLIDRGVAADHTFPTGTAYLLNTPDTTRSVRAINFAQTAKALRGVFPIQVLKTDAIANRKDVLFYFTGLVQVPQLETLQFQPGALADHLTSAGGMLTDSSQMSALRWLEAGATASYGTVVEPCSHLQKFPYPAVAMFYYAKGASAIEAYWKSVAWPGEGVFIGEPLAQPFAPLLKEVSPGQYELSIFVPGKSQLIVESAAARSGPFSPVASQVLHRGLNVQRFGVSDSAEGFLRLRW
jgi:uncharacterized protein (TIGR03790 family)